MPPASSSALLPMEYGSFRMSTVHIHVHTVINLLLCDGHSLTLYSAIPYPHSTYCTLDVGVSTTDQQEMSHLTVAIESSYDQTSVGLILWLYR